MGKDKIYENYRIMSLDGSVIYKSERANSNADKLTAVKGTQLDKEKFGGVLFKNLDTDKLETLICDYEKENSEEFLVGDYLRAIVNVSFRHTVKEFEPHGGVYIRLGYSETDADIEDGVCVQPTHSRVGTKQGHKGLLLHRTKGVGVEGATSEEVATLCRPSIHHIPIRDRILPWARH